jgi:hypothetical protein
VTSGELGSFTKSGESGFELTRFFCKGRGSPIITSSPRHPDLIFIKAEVLDDAKSIKLSLEAWVESKVSWADIPDGIACFEKGRSV